MRVELPRKNPDQLLRAIRKEESGEGYGKLKIFFGYAAGVGKTYAMLEAAHQAKQRGIDVVAGYIEPHARPQTSALVEGLERLPVKEIPYGGIVVREFDIDGALKRNPQLILVDELAHTNAEGSRHTKRYQDVQELLKAGINVYTTVNVQHLESLNDTVASITGVLVRERIPDDVFDRADQVELVDIEPKELLDRMAAGNIYREAQARRAAANFFTVENLTALREIALRRCADRVNLLTESARIQSQGDYHTDEHILVCLSSSPSNPRIIRTAARMASAFRGEFTALYVETPNASALDGEDRKRLRENMRLAQQLGATIETCHGEDIACQIAEYARLSGVSKIVMGRSAATRKGIFSKPTLTERLIANAPNLDIHIIPDASVNGNYRPQKPREPVSVSAQDVLKSLTVLAAATLLSCLFDALGFAESNVIAVYIFGVLVISTVTTNRICSLASSVVSVLMFNFFFTDPRLTLQFFDHGCLVTFAIMFMVAFLSGSLAVRLKDNARQSAHAAFRTKILLETDQLLQKENDAQKILSVTAGQVTKLLKRDLVVYSAEGKELSAPAVYRAQGSGEENLTSENEQAVAVWVLRNNKHAGATTDTLSSARCLYLAIRVNNRVYGVVGIHIGEGQPLDAFENSVLLSILGECALALENSKNAREKEEAAVMAKNEQLRANLLRAISHDLRTPLASISGNASNLLANDQKMDASERTQAFTDIYDDALWLINLVENLLAVTKIEEGKVNLNQSAELMDDVIAEALRHVNRRRQHHIIKVSSSQDLIMAKIDTRLIVQVLINLVDNAIKYTPDGSLIEIHTELRNKWVCVSVSDNGPGIPDDQKPRVFDMFYCGANQVVDSRRSLGLGLPLCKSIVNAHGGRISVTDNVPQGTVFSFTLPAGEVEINE